MNKNQSYYFRGRQQILHEQYLEGLIMLQRSYSPRVKSLDFYSDRLIFDKVQQQLSKERWGNFGDQAHLFTVPCFSNTIVCKEYQIIPDVLKKTISADNLHVHYHRVDIAKTERGTRFELSWSAEHPLDIIIEPKLANHWYHIKPGPLSAWHYGSSLMYYPGYYSNIDYWKERERQITLNILKVSLVRKFSVVYRDIRYLLRTIFRFHFKNLDDEDVDLLNVKYVSSFQQHQLKFLKNETRYKRDRERYSAVAITA